MHPCFIRSGVSITGLFYVLGLCLALVGCGSDDAMPTGAEAAGVSKTLSWSPVPDPSVQGYKLYWGTMSRQYDSQVDVGPNASYTLNGLQSGTTYYFAVSAYNVDGESGMSAEVSSFIE